tara:strand:+ start:448 stop:684 length:237 start_codon:yes stop_codon:yes gene_type:complete
MELNPKLTSYLQGLENLSYLTNPLFINRGVKSNFKLIRIISKLVQSPQLILFFYDCFENLGMCDDINQIAIGGMPADN